MLEKAAHQGPPTTTLSEHESKRYLSRRGIAVPRESLALSPAQAVATARELGYPVALKASGAAYAHKTELGLVELGLKNDREVEEACARLTARAPGLAEFLVQEMVGGGRELIAGLIRDPHYGPAVMLGLGGVQAEALGDVVFRVAPLGEFRGEPAVDRPALARLLVALGEIGLEGPRVAEIDLNPVKLPHGRPVAVDALVVLKD